MNKNRNLVLAVLLITALILAGCTSTKGASTEPTLAQPTAEVQPPAEVQAPKVTPITPVTPATPKQDAAEAAPLIVGTWTEVNRDGNVETVTWGADGSFQGAVITPDGDFVEVDNGWYEFVDGQLVLFIANAGGDWNGGVLEPIDPPLENWYSYYVTKNTLHLERTKWVRFGAEQSFDPPPTDDYTRK